MKKRILSMLLVIVMVLSMVPVTALAAEELKVASTKSSKYVVIGVDEITLSATEIGGAPITSGKLIFEFEPADRITVVSTTDTSCTIKGALQGEVTVTVRGETSGRTGTKRLTVILPPENLKIVTAGTTEAPASTMKVGESVQLGYTCSNADKIESALIVTDWKVKNESKTGVLTVSDAGVLTAGKVGTAEVRFAMNGKSVSQEFSVVPADPGKITVTSENNVTSIITGRELTLFANIEGLSSLKNFTWELAPGSENDVVSLVGSTTDNTCDVKGLKAGTVGIIAKRSIGSGDEKKDYVSDVFTVTVQDRTLLTMQAEKDQVYTTKTVKFSVVDANGNAMEGVRWSVGAGSTATIDQQTGVLTAGTVAEKVTVRAYVNDQYTIAPMEFSVVQNSMNIYKKGATDVLTQIDVNDPIELEVRDIEGDPVTVTSIEKGTDAESALELTKSAEGVYQLKGLKKSAPIDITAKADGFGDVTQAITVNNKSFKVKNGSEELNSDSVLSIYVGDTITLTAVDGKTARWDSDKDDKATIGRHDGKLEGIAPTGEGETVLINVDVEGYDRASFRVKVLPKNTFIKLRLDNPDVRPTDLAVGETRQLVALKDTTSGPVEGVEWKIVSGNEFAVLDGDQLTGKADGDVELTAECVGFNSQTVTIHVTTEKLNSVTIPASLELNEGQEEDLLADAVFDPVYASDKAVTFSTKDENIEIDGSKVKAKRYGTATVTGTYLSGTEEKTVKVTVTVKAANHIELVDLDPTIPTELVCGDTLELKAVLKNAAGETLETPVQWQLSNDKVIKNLVDLTGNKLTAHPQSTYDFKVFLEAFVEGNDQVEPIIVTVHVIPRTTNIALKKGDEDISDKTIVLNVNDPNGITIDAVIKPNDASQVVDWEIDGPNSIYKATRSEKGIKIEPVITRKTGTITVTATAKDGTGISRKTTIVFAKMADRVVITNAPGMMMGGANIQLRTNLDEDKTITERSVKWSIVDETGKEGNTRYASVTADGLLDTKSVTERTKIYVQATMLANPGNPPDVKEIWLCPAVNRINIMQQTGTTDSKGDPILINVKNVVDYSEKTIKLDKIAYPAGHIASFVWDSSNKAVADFVPGTSELQLKGAGKTQITCTATDGSNTRGVYNLEVVKTAGYVVIDEVDPLVSGKNTVLTATVYTDETCTELAANQKVTWSVEDEYGNPTKAATINSRGRLYAKTVKYGTEVVVVAKSVENKDAEPGRISVTIKPKQAKTFMAVMTADPEGIILGSSLDLNVGVETSIFGQWYISEDNEFDREYDCTYNSSNPDVASIDPEGTLITKKSGSTVITVRATDPDTHNVYTTKFTLRVANLVGHVHIDEADKSLTMRSGQSMNLTATAWTDSGMATKSDNQGFIWKVYQEDEETGERIIAKAASVSSSGQVYANSVTKNTMVWVEAISRENSDQISSPCPIMIRPKDVYTPRVFFEGVDENGEYKELSGTVSRSITSDPREIQIRAYASDPSFDYTMDGYDMYPVTVFNVTWDSSNKKVIDVVGKDLVYKDTGKATVTAKFTANGITYSASITINVVRPVTSLEVTSRTSSLDMYAGKSLLMLAKVNSDATNKRVEWSFFDEDDYEIASINSTTGLIRAKKGLTDRETVTVIAKTTDGSEITSVPVTVTIYPLATKVEINEDSRITMVKGAQDTLTATVYPDGDLGAKQKVTWSSSRSSVVSVDKEGNITAKRRGTATIKAKATDGSGKYATIRITVVNP